MYIKVFFGVKFRCYVIMLFLIEECIILKFEENYYLLNIMYFDNIYKELKILK